jgi:hypothetical protein
MLVTYPDTHGHAPHLPLIVRVRDSSPVTLELPLGLACALSMGDDKPKA